jgi:hypothetical protein
VPSIATIGRLSLVPLVLPWALASPNGKMPPSEATSQ